MKDMNYSKFEIRKCNSGDIQSILDLQNRVIRGMEDSDILRENTREMFELCMESANLTLGVFDENYLFAVTILHDAKGTDEDLSVDLIKYTSVNAVNYKLIMVDEKYRGLNLQKSLFWILEKYAYNKGIKDFCVTVSPKNHISLANILEMGFVVDHQAMKYENVERIVLYNYFADYVSKYNKKIIAFLDFIEGKGSINDFVFEGINFERCFQGHIDIASTGDIVEYTDTESGKTVFGMYLNILSPHICIYLPSKKKIGIVEFSRNIDTLDFNKVWINTQKII